MGIGSCSTGWVYWVLVLVHEKMWLLTKWGPLGYCTYTLFIPSCRHFRPTNVEISILAVNEFLEILFGNSLCPIPSVWSIFILKSKVGICLLKTKHPKFTAELFRFSPPNNKKANFIQFLFLFEIVHCEWWVVLGLDMVRCQVQHKQSRNLPIEYLIIQI